MNRIAKTIGLNLATVVIVGALGLLLKAQEPASLTGTWTAAGDLGQVPAGAATASLADGRLVVVGGTGSDGQPLAGVTIFDAASGWTPAGSLATARTGATATALADGSVVVAGGTTADGVASTVEIYSAATGTSAAAGAMTGPRTDHGAAALKDGTVFIVGGFDGTGLLQSAEIYDPDTGTSSLSAAALTTPRSKLTATALLDGHVLVAGGNDGTQDLAEAVVYDAAVGFIPTGAMATPRSGHTAVLLADNANVLVAGGTTGSSASAPGAPVASAELYADWLNGFQSTGAMAAARTGAIGGSLKAYDVGLAAGGGSTTGEYYHHATVTTDKDDYAPGELVTITGSGWQPGETVSIHITEDADTHNDFAYTALVQPDGTFTSAEFAPIEDDTYHHLGARLYLTVNDSVSQAMSTFTDASNFTVTPLSTSVAAGSSNTFTWKFTGANGAAGSAATLIVPVTWPNPTGLVTVAPTTTNCTSASLSSITGTGPWTINIAYSCANNQSFNVAYGPVTTPTVAGTTTFTSTPVTASPAVTLTPGPVTAANSTVVAVPTSVPANNVTTSTITVTLKDANNNPVSGKTVTLAKSGGSSTISAASGPSTAAGVVTFTVKDAVVEGPTVYTATDTTDSVVITQTASVTFVAVPNAGNSTITGTGPVVANGVATSTVTITIKDAANVGIAGYTPTFSATNTGATNVNGVCSVTDGTGVSTCTLASTKAEVKTLSIVTPVAKVGGTVTFTAGAAAGAPFSTITGTGPVAADGIASSTVTITLRDAFSNPISGVTPTFSATDTGATNVYGACSATNGSGVSTCTLKSTMVEVKTLSIVTPVALSGGTVTFVAGALHHFKVEAAAGGNIGTQTAGIAFNVKVTAQDAGNNTVTSFSGGGNKVNLSSTGTLIVTGGNPTAAFTSGVLASQGVTITNTGNFTITATGNGASSGISGPASNSFMVNPGAVNAGTSTVSAIPTLVPADNTTTSTVTVTLRDGFSNVVPGKTVTLAAGSGSSTISPASGLSNGSGVVTFTVKDAVGEIVTYTATDTTDALVITQTAAVNFTAVNVTGSVLITRGGYSLNRTTSRYVQSVTVKNTSLSTITGPISYVLDSLAGATLYLPAGTTAITTPAGSPYATLTAGNLAPGASVTIALQYVGAGPISYTARVLAGTGAR